MNYIIYVDCHNYIHSQLALPSMFSCLILLVESRQMKYITECAEAQTLDTEHMNSSPASSRKQHQRKPISHF